MGGCRAQLRSVRLSQELTFPLTLLGRADEVIE